MNKSTTKFLNILTIISLFIMIGSLCLTIYMEYNNNLFEKQVVVSKCEAVQKKVNATEFRVTRYNDCYIKIKDYWTEVSDFQLEVVLGIISVDSE